MQPPGPDPLHIDRADPVYASALTDSVPDRRVSCWYLNFYAHDKPPSAAGRYDDAAWAGEMSARVDEAGRAGMAGPFAPWSAERLGADMLATLNTRYDMEFPYTPHHGGIDREAVARGARWVIDERTVATWDSVYREVLSESMTAFLERYGRMLWLRDVVGRDEPFNRTSAVRAPDVAGVAAAVLHERYGVALTLPAGNPNEPWYEWPTPREFRTAGPYDAARFRVAFWRYMNEWLAEGAAEELALVRRFAPDAEFTACNRNAINIRDPFHAEINHALDFIDQAALFDATDIFSADPYPTAILDRHGHARARYHVGFTGKLVTDLAAGKPVRLILQAFPFHGRTPSPENLREWCSQAAKTGVTHLEWFDTGNPRVSDPPLYAEMMRLSSLWRTLPSMDVPDTARVAVIFGDDARAADNDPVLSAHYVLHVLLGERLGAWYRFIGENQMWRGQSSLDGVRLVIVPSLAWCSRASAEMIVRQARAGATLLVLDPDAMMHDIGSGPLDDLWRDAAGTVRGVSREVPSRLVPTTEGRRRFPGIEALTVREGDMMRARALAVPSDGTVLFTDEGGVPVLYSRPLGAGEVIICGVRPLADPETAVANDGWEDFLAALCEESGVPGGLDVWRFHIPAEVREPGVPRGVPTN